MNHELFFVVWREDGGTPTYKHPNIQSAEAEAERLARMFPGINFHVLACVGTVKKQDVEWTRMPVDDIPF